MTTDQQAYMEFPCHFPIKAMGAAKPGFMEQIIGIVKQHAPDVPDHAIRSARSRTGKYLSVTIVITATSKTQLDNIYEELSACENVMVAL